jgi:hypothetical protein
MRQCAFCDCSLNTTRYFSTSGFAALSIAQGPPEESRGAPITFSTTTLRDFSPLDVSACQDCLFRRLRKELLTPTVVSLIIALLGSAFALAPVLLLQADFPWPYYVVLLAAAWGYFIVNLFFYLIPYFRRRPSQGLVDSLLNEAAQQAARGVPGRNRFISRSEYGQLASRS